MASLAHLRPVVPRQVLLRLGRASAVSPVAVMLVVLALAGAAWALLGPVVRNAQIMVRRALRSAEMRGHIRRNVALQVPLRRVPRNPRTALTPDMARRILAAVAGDRYEAAFALAFIGLREGEILGLAREDIDLEACTAAVRYELVGSGPAATRHQLKTEASEATVPLPAFAVARLRSHLERQQQERPDQAPTNGLAFVTERGYAVNGSWLTKHFQALLQRAALPKMRLHDFATERRAYWSGQASIHASPRSCCVTRRARRRWRSTATSAPRSNAKR